MINLRLRKLLKYKYLKKNVVMHIIPKNKWGYMHFILSH